MTNEILETLVSPEDFETENITLSITTERERREIEIPVNLVADMDALIANLRERGVDVPSSPMLTRNEKGFVLHETPSFG